MRTYSRKYSYRGLKPRENPLNHETLDRMKRWPSILKRWSGALVRIWSAEHDAYWRNGGHGYTSDGLEAGTWPMETAFSMTRGCGPEKRIQFKRVRDGHPPRL